MAILVSHGSRDGLCSVGSSATPPPPPPAAAVCSGLPCSGGANVHRRPQRSEGRGEGVTLGSLKAEQKPTSVRTVGFDLKGVPTERQCEDFPNLRQQPIFVLFKCKDLYKRTKGVALGCNISRTDLENWSSCSPVAIESAGMRGQAPAVVLAQPRPS